MTKTILAIGHSHLTALAEAYAALPAGADLPYRLSSLQLLRRGSPGLVHTNGMPNYAPAVELEVLDKVQAVAPDLIVLLLEGQQAATLGLAVPTHPWDFMLPNEQGSHAIEGDLLPFDLVTEVARRYFAHIGRFLDRVRDALGPRVVAISPPPPFGDDEILLEKIRINPVLRDAVLATGLAPRAWRRRVWIIMVTALAEAYITRGIGFLPAPEGAMDEGGFLPIPLLWDGIHGNPRYGDLVLRQLVEWTRAD